MKLSITLPDDLGEEVRARAREQGISVSRYVAEALIDEERRRSFEAWADEAMAKAAPTEKDIAEVREVIDRARQRVREQLNRRAREQVKAG
jgi:post-segregation antitoxin (ccd killing protein)